MSILGPFITCQYSCDSCGVVSREVQVPARTSEDVIAWLEETCSPAIAKDHQSVSPLCKATEITDLYIPIEGDRVGGPIVQ